VHKDASLLEDVYVNIPLIDKHGGRQAIKRDLQYNKIFVEVLLRNILIVFPGLLPLPISSKE
jgi:hypothetical protein